MDAATVAGVGAIAGGAVTAVVTWLLHRRRDHAEVDRLRGERDQLKGAAEQAHANAAAAITTAATALLKPLQTRVEQLEDLVGKQRAELAELRPLKVEVERLRSANAELIEQLEGVRSENARLNAQLRGLRVDLDERTQQGTPR